MAVNGHSVECNTTASGKRCYLEFLRLLVIVHKSSWF